MKTVITLAAAGVFALSTSAWAGEGYNCGGYQQTVQTEKPTITLATPKATTKESASTQTASTQITSTGDKTTKPGS
jgi:hypothetical protein